MIFEPGEKNLIIVRKNLFVFIIETIGLIFLAILPIFLGILLKLTTQLDFSFTFIDFSVIDTNLIIYFYSLYLLGIWLRFITNLTNYFFDKWVITNRRIIDIEQKSFFSRKESSVRFNNIQDITINVSGIFATLLDFGTISVQTAGAEKEFELKLAAKPAQTKEYIMALREKFMSDFGNNNPLNTTNL